MKRSSTCRLRKVSCEECGYTVRMARSWMVQGLPVCPCGSQMRPTTPADLAFVGLIGIDDMSAKAWTEVCRENGWEDSIIRRGAAAKAHARRELEAGGFSARRSKPQCSFAGCGRWTADQAEYCHEHDPALVLEAAPF